MASGSISLSSSKAWKGSIDWSSTADVNTNTSKVYVKATMWKTDGYLTSSNSYTSGTITINGTSYDLTGYQQFKDTVTIFERTITIAHNDDGTKSISISLSCKGQANTSLSSATLSGSGTAVLDKINRKSTMSASDGTLGTPQTLTVNQSTTSFTHTIEYKCGTASGTIVSKSSSTSISWTPPLSLAAQDTEKTSVSVTLTITTYNGSTNIGSNSVTITCSMPASIKPSCRITVTDPTGNHDTYGNYIKNQSRLQIVVTPTLSYGSEIISYSVTANGSKYTTASFATGVIQESGEMTITATVTDKRGRTGTASVTIDVVDYPKPAILKLSVNRCGNDGTEDMSGEYVKVTFSAKVHNLDGMNTATYVLGYKKTSDTEYTEVTLTALANTFVVTDAQYIFKADTGSSYNVEVFITDNFTTVERATSASTAFAMMHWHTDGTGMAVGKVSELSRVFDIGILIRFYGGIMPTVLPAETDLDDIKTPGIYAGNDVSSTSYSNTPSASGAFALLVDGCGSEGQVKQTYSSCSIITPEKYVRFYCGGVWGDWLRESTGECILYENDSGSAETITLSVDMSQFRYIEIFYTDNNGKAGGYTKIYKPDGKTICLQIVEANGTVYSRQTMYAASGITLEPKTSSAGYYTVSSSGTVKAYTPMNLIKVVRVIGVA